MLVPIFTFKINHRVNPHMVTVGRYNGKHTALTCATAAGKVSTVIWCISGHPCFSILPSLRNHCALYDSSMQKTMLWSSTEKILLVITEISIFKKHALVGR